MNQTLIDLPLPEWMNAKNVGKSFEGTYIVEGVIATFYHNGFGIYQVTDENGYKFILCGTFAAFLEEGHTYEVKGKVIDYKGELRFMAYKAIPIKPSNKLGVIKYLQQLEGVHSKAEKLYDKFGEDALSLIVENPELVANSIAGISIKSVMSWKKQIEEKEEEQFVIVALLGYGLTDKEVRSLFNLYGESIIHEIKRNPYTLSLKVKGYGFLKCDALAVELGVPLDSPERIAAGIVHLLNESKQNGHCYLPYKVLFHKIQNLLNIELNKDDVELMKRNRDENGDYYWIVGDTAYTIEKIAFERMYFDISSGKKVGYPIVQIREDAYKEALAHLESDLQIKILEDRIYEPALYFAEGDVVKNVLRFLLQDVNAENANRVYEAYLKKTGYQLELKQAEAVKKFASTRYGIQILCGGAGVGKTFTLNIILKMLEIQARLEKRNIEIKIFAPTGRAAKVASVATKRKAETVHRGLEYSPVNGFTFNERNPIDADVVIIDEFSMMDVELTAHLFNAIPAECKVILIGDTKQLSSVGPGRVLKDLIESNLIPTVMLDVVKRQAEGSDIIANANRIIEGKMIEVLPNTKDAYFLPKTDVIASQKALLDGINRLLENGEKIKDIQVLVPMKKGEMGIDVLNYLIQQRFNKHRENYNKVLNKTFTRSLSSKVELYFCVGDKVMQTDNNYDIECYERRDARFVKLKQTGVMNGEVGHIVGIHKTVNDKNEEITEMWVKYEDAYVKYVDDFSELDHAYCMTIHKAQGSQWKNVFLLIMKNHYRMLENSIIYTGYTRAQEFLCLIGDPSAIEYAIKTQNSSTRYTSITHILQTYMSA